MVGTFKKIGKEILVSNKTNNYDLGPAMTVLADGRVLITWEDQSATGQDKSGSSVRGRILNANGTESVPEFVVNKTTLGDQNEGTVTALADGRFIVTWTDYSKSGGDKSSTDIRARIFNANGTESVPEFIVNTTTNGDQTESAVQALSDGRFIVTWTDNSKSADNPSSTAVRGRIFNADGTTSVPEFLINTNRNGNQLGSHITALSDGRFIVTWEDDAASPDSPAGSAIRAKIFNADGTTSVAEFRVNSFIPADPAILTLNFHGTVTALDNGRFIVTWSQEKQVNKWGNPQPLSFTIQGQIFNADGSKSGAEFMVSNVTTKLYGIYSSVTALGDGRFIVTWTDGSNSGSDDASQTAVRGQIFDAYGNKSGTAFLINTITNGKQYDSIVKALGNGLFMVSWSDDSFSKDHSYGTAIRSQIFDSKIYNGDASNETIIGGSLNDTISGGGGNDKIDGGGGYNTAVYSIASTQATWKKNADGTWTVTAGKDGTDTLSNIQELKFSDKTVKLQSPAAAQSDFNGDGVSDLSVYNSVTGEFNIWTMNADGTIKNSTPYGTFDKAWQVAGNGDYNGDGIKDIVWRNNDTGEVGQWILDGNGSVSWHSQGGVTLDWQIAGTDDFNHDGIADILWRNKDTGEVGEWIMNADGTTAAWHTQSYVDLSWQVAGTDDFNHDGIADILWRNKDTGEVGEWIMNADGTTAAWHTQGVAADLSWQIAGTGDFNHDGIADILWRNKDTGEVGEWIMNADGTTAAWHTQSYVDLSWQIAGIGDYNGDGIADILWRNSNSGEVGEWIMNTDGTTAAWHSQGVITNDWKLTKS